MNVHETRYKTLYEMIFHQRTIILDIFMVLASVVFMAIMANLQIPLWPVPITMQTFGIFLIAFFFGSRKGLVAIAAYVLAGLLGFGVFAGYKSGIKAILGPTGGYIIGFLFMAFFIGLMIEKGYGRTRKSILLCMLAGEIILYVFGLVGLQLNIGTSILKTLQYGLFPFIIGDTLKAFMAAAFFPYLWQGAEKLEKAK
ncbi:biotin transporter BioY [Candidatus Woesearchaeota archaeon]|nr:biotin transporter BioY [Candidatus Woesearchaeota archaeon]